MTIDYRSPQAAEYRKLYQSARWKLLRTGQLTKQPLCERCLAMTPERVTLATVANHRIPHKGDLKLFFDPANLESSCKPHHDGLIQREEARGYVIGCDAKGRPLDPQHPWNRSRAKVSSVTSLQADHT